MRKSLWALIFCAAGWAAAPAAGAGQSTVPPDSVLVARVEAAIAAASDLVADSLSVSASQGVVTITGSVVCDDCGGSRTPGGSATVQQSLGAVVRAVPGVGRVRFDLRYRRP